MNIGDYPQLTYVHEPENICSSPHEHMFIKKGCKKRVNAKKAGGRLVPLDGLLTSFGLPA